MAHHTHRPRRPHVKFTEDGTRLEQVLTRQVLGPGKRKAAQHPWAFLLWAARNGAPEKTLVKLRADAGIGR